MAIATVTLTALTLVPAFGNLSGGASVAQSVPSVQAVPTHSTLLQTASRIAQLPTTEASPSPASAEPTPGLPNIMLLATGGTIAGTGATSTTTVGYQAATLPIDTLITAVPELKTIANVTGEQVLQIASQDMTTDGLLKIAKRINELLAQSNIDGIVITHGTDTLEETAYFLDLVVKSQKPVVVVGAMRPATALSADGPLNLYNAVAVAGSQEAINQGVLVVLNDQISAARDVTKSSTTAVDTFQSRDFGSLGYVELGKPYFYRLPTHQHTVDTPFNVNNLSTLPQVDIIYGYSANTGALIDASVASGSKGIVYAGVGNGNFSKQVIPNVMNATMQGVAIARSARTGSGRVARNAEMNDDELGTVAADNLLPQKARILLMLALTQTTNPAAIQEMFYSY